MRYLLLFIYTILGGFIFSACQHGKAALESVITTTKTVEETPTSILLLGTAQDAGSPHIACAKSCCAAGFKEDSDAKRVISLGVYDATTKHRYLFEATPDITSQVKQLSKFGAPTDQELPVGIFLTHAHIGHYTGLMYLGKEATDAKGVAVYAMPQMRNYLTNNGPWSQLVTRQNIRLQMLQEDEPLSLSETLAVTPFLVPHRDEFSETVGYTITGPSKSALFIPDIDKWGKWKRRIIDEIKKVDYAFVDATFYSGAEIDHRDITQIPHPTVIESMALFKTLSRTDRNKVIFIHFNHTNPLLTITSKEAKQVLANGFRIGQRNDTYPL